MNFLNCRHFKAVFSWFDYALVNVLLCVTQYMFLQFQDSLQGYKTQNKFLNKEILELTVLRRSAESREKTLEAKVYLVFVCNGVTLLIETGSLSS